MHVWLLQVMMLGILSDINETKKFKKKKVDALFTILVAKTSSAACFI